MPIDLAMNNAAKKVSVSANVRKQNYLTLKFSDPQI